MNKDIIDIGTQAGLMMPCWQHCSLSSWNSAELDAYLDILSNYINLKDLRQDKECGPQQVQKFRGNPRIQRASDVPQLPAFSLSASLTTATSAWP